MILRKRVLLPLLLSGLVCCGCTADMETSGDSETTTTASDDTAVSRDIFAMDTYMQLTAYGVNAETAVADAVTYIEQMDAMLSTGTETSEIAMLNANGEATLSPDAAAIMQRAIALSQDTDGAFNPLMYPIMQAWGFPTKEFRVPEQTELQQLLLLTNLDNLQFDAETGETSFAVDGMEVDFGGIAKGYTSAKISKIFKEDGVTSGIITLGGNVQAIGTKTDGSNWRVAIQNPDEDAEFLGVLETSDRAVITSGGYERYFEQDGVTYHHIIDPETGMPAESGLTSVTIVSEDGTLADGLSTALFVMGLEKATAYWQAHSDTFDAIFLTDDQTLYVTEGIRDAFSSSYEWNVLEKGDA